MDLGPLQTHWMKPRVMLLSSFRMIAGSTVPLAHPQSSGYSSPSLNLMPRYDGPSDFCTKFLIRNQPCTFRSAWSAASSSIMPASSVHKFSTRLANSCLTEYKVSNCNLDDDIVKQTFRFQHLMLLLIITSCSSTTSSTFNSERANNQSQKPILNYTVMPEQECPKSHIALAIIRSEVVHPSAKICYYG